jgi:hypothetical protein
VTSVLIGTPCGDSIRPATVATILDNCMDLRRNGTFCSWLAAEGSQVHKNQNALAQEALDGCHTHLLLLDSDMVAPANAAWRLLSRKRDIVGITCPSRLAPEQFVGRMLDGMRPFGHERGLGQMQWCGSGLLLIRTQVFRDMPAPWFRFEGLMGNDEWFGTHAPTRSYCDFDLSREIGHLAVTELKGNWT